MYLVHMLQATLEYSTYSAKYNLLGTWVPKEGNQTLPAYTKKDTCTWAVWSAVYVTIYIHSMYVSMYVL